MYTKLRSSGILSRMSYRGKGFVKTLLVTLSGKVLFKIVIKSTVRSITKLLTLIMFV